MVDDGTNHIEPGRGTCTNVRWTWYSALSSESSTERSDVSLRSGTVMASRLNLVLLRSFLSRASVAVSTALWIWTSSRGVPTTC